MITAGIPAPSTPASRPSPSQLAAKAAASWTPNPKPLREATTSTVSGDFCPKDRLFWVNYNGKYLWPALLYANSAEFLYRCDNIDQKAKADLCVDMIEQYVDDLKKRTTAATSKKESTKFARLLGFSTLKWQLVPDEEYYDCNDGTAFALREMVEHPEYFRGERDLYLAFMKAMDEVKDICAGTNEKKRHFQDLGQTLLSSAMVQDAATATPASARTTTTYESVDPANFTTPQSNAPGTHRYSHEDGATVISSEETAVHDYGVLPGDSFNEAVNKLQLAGPDHCWTFEHRNGRFLAYNAAGECKFRSQQGLCEYLRQSCHWRGPSSDDEEKEEEMQVESEVQTIRKDNAKSKASRQKQTPSSGKTKAPAKVTPAKKGRGGGRKTKKGMPTGKTAARVNLDKQKVITPSRAVERRSSRARTPAKPAGESAVGAIADRDPKAKKFNHLLPFLKAFLAWKYKYTSSNLKTDLYIRTKEEKDGGKHGVDFFYEKEEVMDFFENSGYMQEHEKKWNAYLEHNPLP